MKIKTIWESDELRWSIDEITYKENRAKSNRLMKLIASKKAFDIGWVGLKKEIVSFNIRRDNDGGLTRLSVCQSMDDLPYDLIGDADLEGELTDKDIEKIYENEGYSLALSEVSTECTRDCFVRSNASLETITKKLMKLWSDTDEFLKGEFEVVKTIVDEYKNRKKPH